MRCKDKDLKAAVEPVSGDQFKDQSLQRVVGAGCVQSKHVKVPAVDILRGRDQSETTLLMPGARRVCTIPPV